MTTADLVSIFGAGMIAGVAFAAIPVFIARWVVSGYIERARWANWWSARDARTRRVRL